MNSGDDSFLSSEAASTGHAAGEIAFVGINNAGAARAKCGDIVLRSGMIPHVDVHRGSENDWSRGGEIQRRKEIVGDAAGKFRETIRGGRGDKKQISPLSDCNVLNGAFEIGFAFGL